MKKTIIAIIVSLICLFLASSCCNKEDEVYWPPDEAIRYYDDNDTIIFYCPESEEFKKYIVCIRDSEESIEQYYYNRFCEYAVFTNSLHYILYHDSCGSTKIMTISITASYQDLIQVGITENGSNSGVFVAGYDNYKQNSIDILGYTYHEVIEIPGSELYDEISSILFSYEYGVIQIKYEDRTFSLINNNEN